MKFTGRIYCWAEGEAPQDYKALAPFMVVNASLTRTELLLEWTEEGYSGTLVALSRDGKTYRGRYEFKEFPGTRYRATLELVRPGVLEGSWAEEDGYKGRWVIELMRPAQQRTLTAAEGELSRLA
jgi:hypothetical protein